MGDPSLPESQNPFEKFEPKRTDVDLAEIIRITREWEPILIAQAKATDGSWSISDLKRKIEEEHNSIDFAVTAQITVVKGVEPVIAISDPRDALSHPLKIIFGVDTFNMRPSSGFVYLAELEVPGRVGKITARAIHLLDLRSSSDNHIVISEGLREKLGISQDDKIRILDIYQDVSEINLDNQLRRSVR